jgi:lipopolysaccharide assembly outer membrane protein LptD (OstA)/peptidoglycan hydrolase-like protein with peptidoglycan-binding domain
LVTKNKKYILPLGLMLLCAWALFGAQTPRRTSREGLSSGAQAATQTPVSAPVPAPAGAQALRATPRTLQDSLPDIDVSPEADAAAAERQLEAQEIAEDSILAKVDSALFAPPRPPRDTTKKKSFLDDPIYGQNQDSLVYEPGNKMVYIYEKGDVTYQQMNLKADFIRVNMETKVIYAYGRMDSVVNEKGDTVRKPTRPQFLEGDHTYEMDTITYNLGSKKAKIKGVATQEGEGWLIGDDIKKMPDNTINIAHGKYTTCDHVDHPHFYLYMTKAKAIPGKKIIVGPSYLVFEDVPIYFLGVPFAFFPMSSGRQSGWIVPEYGEDYTKGFFIRNGGYYFAINEYVDVTATAGIYTLGSWEANLASRYLKRYKYSGNFSFRFSRDKIEDQLDQKSYQLQWSHQQDPKFRPNSTFSASVNFSSSGYSKYGSTTMNDYLSTNTSSSISYSKRWPGKPFSLTMSMQHSQNSADTTIMLSIPNINFNVSKIYPFRRKEAMGKQRWYEKIGLTYTGALANSVTTKEYDLGTEKMFKQMKNGVNHTIPVSASFNVLKYINLTPSINYNERWYFSSVEQHWDPTVGRVVRGDTTYGFNRVWNYSVSASTSTKVYGTFQYGPKFPVQAIRHVMTPTVGFSLTPDFSDPRYGFYKPVQTDSTGTVGYYSPYEGGMYGIPGRGKSASMSFSLSNTIEMKVRSKTDTTGVKKLKIIDNLSASSSWNFLADSLNLSPFSLNLRTANLFGNFALNLSATLDPYELAPGPNGVGYKRINQFMMKRGKPGRITSTGWSFGYSFQSSKQAGAINDANSAAPAVMHTDPNFFNDPNQIDATTRRQMMVGQYYDFSIPWNLSFNYSMSYSKPGYEATVTQGLTFNGSVNLTPKMGVTFSAGYDFESKKMTPGTINFTRDLHCWQMSFSWVPIGFRQQWSFNIGVKSAMLKDLKYDKHNSYYDNLYD